jgi:hypothetical protein
MAKDDRSLTKPSSRREIDAFLDRLAATPKVRPAGHRGRLLFALDATASREPTWDQASRLQAQMFAETAALGGLDVQLCYYRGYSEFKATPWLSDADALLRRMTGVFCLAGITQIERVLRHAIQETRRQKVDALVFVGDSMEEDVDALGRLAGELGILRLPAFLFHEGGDPVAARAFEQMARLSGGACCPFDASSPAQLRDLLRAVAVYAAGGRQALEDFGQRQGGEVRRLVHQLKRD